MRIRIATNKGAVPLASSLKQYIMEQGNFSRLDADHYVKFLHEHGSVIIYIMGMRKIEWPSFKKTVTLYGYESELIQ